MVVGERASTSGAQLPTTSNQEDQIKSSGIEKKELGALRKRGCDHDTKLPSPTQIDSSVYTISSPQNWSSSTLSVDVAEGRPGISAWLPTNTNQQPDDSSSLISVSDGEYLFSKEHHDQNKGLHDGENTSNAAVSSPREPNQANNAETSSEVDRVRMQEGVEAAQQAAGGSHIVPDPDHDDNADVASIFSDGGYESDNVTRGSTSISSGVRDYVWENGRRYHRFREGRYNFPNDDVEQEREDMKHAMVKMLCQKLYFAPITDESQMILDVATGTGSWAIEMGDEFPNAQILGIDLSPIQPDWVPPNVRFMVDDAESAWLFPRNHFDYIHCRHTIQAIKNWPRLLRRAYEHMRPGGWIELQEVFHYPLSANDTMPHDHPVAQYWQLVFEGLFNLGLDFHASKGDRLSRMIRDADFGNLSEKMFQIPIGPWAKNRVLKAVGVYWRQILLDGIEAICLAPLTRGLGWSREQVEVFIVQVRRAYMDTACLLYMPMTIVWGQKVDE